MERKIRNIVIAHPLPTIETLIYGNILRDFFQSCGFFIFESNKEELVLEEILPKEDSVELWITNKNEKISIFIRNTEEAVELSKEDYKDTKNVMDKIIKFVFLPMINFYKDSDTKKFIQEIDDICECYLENELIFAEYEHKNFYYDHEVLKKNQERYQKAEREIKIEEDSSIYKRFFKFHCKKRWEDSEQILQYRTEIDSTEKFLMEIQELIEMDPKMSKSYLLGAEIASRDELWVKHANRFYNMVLKVFQNDQKKITYRGIDRLIYQQGKYYEKKVKKKDLAFKCYQIAYNMNKDNYRAAYKIAVFYSNKKEEENYLRYLNETLMIIVKIPKELWQVQEIEYMYKIYHLLSNFYDKKGDSIKKDKYINKKECIVKMVGNFEQYPYLREFYKYDKEEVLDKRVNSWKEHFKIMEF